MDTDSFLTAVDDIITKQEKEMQEGLHKVGKLVYKIYEKSVTLHKCLPNAFQQATYLGGISFKNNDFSYSVDLLLGQSIELTFKGKYTFTYSEINKDKSPNWEICLSDLDDKVTAVDIYSTVWNLLEWLNNYSSQNEERIKDIIEKLEIM